MPYGITKIPTWSSHKFQPTDTQIDWEKKIFFVLLNNWVMLLCTFAYSNQKIERRHTKESKV